MIRIKGNKQVQIQACAETENRARVQKRAEKVRAG